jgi:hypothetical protein
MKQKKMRLRHTTVLFCNFQRVKTRKKLKVGRNDRYYVVDKGIRDRSRMVIFICIGADGSVAMEKWPVSKK